MLQALYKNDKLHHAVSVNCQHQSRLNRPANCLCYKLSRQRQNVVAATGKARSPNVERRVDVEADRRYRQTSTCRTLLISRRQSRITYCAWLLVWRITLIIISPHGALCYAKLDFNIMHRIILSWIIACRNRNCLPSDSTVTHSLLLKVNKIKNTVITHSIAPAKLRFIRAAVMH